MGENEPQVKNVDPGEKISKGGKGDISSGPATDRGCTDILCLLLFIGHWFVFWYVAGLGFQKGDARKVVYPTDSLGRVCGLPNDQTPNLTLGSYSVDMSAYQHVAYTFNVTEMFGPAVRSAICSGGIPTLAVETTLTAAGKCLAGSSCKENWKRACAMTIPGAGIDVQKFAANPIGEMKAFLEGGNGESPLKKIGKYVFNSCVKNCATMNDFSVAPATNTSTRPWALDFDDDILWAEAWHTIIGSGPPGPFNNLAVAALPEDVCPYPTRYCIFFPGTKMAEAAGRCVLAMDALSDVASAALDNALVKAAEGILGDAVGQMGRTYYVFIIVTFVILVIGVIFLIVLRFTVGIFVWLSITATFLSLVAVGAYSLWIAKFACQGDTITSSAQAAVDVGITNFSGQCNGLFKEPDEQKRNLYFYVSIGALVLALLYLLIVLCSCKRIRLAIGINKVAARFVYSNKKVIFIPVVQIVMAVIWWALWIVCALFAISNTTARYEKINKDGPYTWCEAEGAFAGSDCGNTAALVGKCTGVWPAAPVWKDINLAGCTCTGNSTCDTGALRCYRCGPPRFDMEPPDGWPFWFLLFSLLWNNAVLVAIGQMTIAGAVGVWYFNQRDMSDKYPVATGFKNCFRYHLGSIAFGSFILAIVQLVKWWLRYMQKQMEAQKQGLMAKIAGALAYCVWCFERCIKFLNKNAYIRIALVGENFCKAAWKAFQLIIRNMGRYAVIGGLGGIISKLGTLFIAAAGTFLGYFIFVALHPEETPWFCVALYFIMGFIGGKFVMNVFGLAVDSVLVCFITDEEVNDGDAQNTPKELQEFLSK